MSETPLEVDCQTVKARLDAGEDFALIDCREQDEYDLVRIAGATLIPMSEVQQRAGELTALAGRSVVVHCHHGGRSMRVAMWLRQQGVSQAQSMAGGIDAWAAEIDPTLPRY